MAQSQEPMPRMLSTGVPNLDLVLGGGLQWHNAYLFAGPAGAGKSVLSEQIAFHRAREGERVLLLTGLDEPHRNLLEHLSTLRFADLSLVGPLIDIVSMAPFLEQPLAHRTDVLRKTVLNVRPQLVILDGFRSFETFTESQHEVHRFIYDLTSWFAVEGITLILTRNSASSDLPDLPEYSLVDGVLLLQTMVQDGRWTRRLIVQKMRGQQYLPGPHAFTIDQNGVTVWPRPQATFARADRPQAGARARFGIPSLDTMLAGGLPRATATLLVGDLGSARTALALCFLAAGQQEGEPGLWVGFSDSRDRLLRMARDLGIALPEPEAGGQVSFLLLPPFELLAGEVAARIQQQAAEIGARRVVLDGAEVLDEALASRGEARSFLAWLMQALPQHDITTLVSRYTPGTPGFWPDPISGGLAALADSVILVRQVRRRAELGHALAILKMPEPDYDRAVRELVLGREGITVGAPLESKPGIPGPGADAEPARGPA